MDDERRGGRNFKSAFRRAMSPLGILGGEERKPESGWSLRRETKYLMLVRHRPQGDDETFQKYDKDSIAQQLLIENADLEGLNARIEITTPLVQEYGKKAKTKLPHGWKLAGLAVDIADKKRVVALGIHLEHVSISFLTLAYQFDRNMKLNIVQSRGLWTDVPPIPRPLSNKRVLSEFMDINDQLSPEAGANLETALSVIREFQRKHAV